MVVSANKCSEPYDPGPGIVRPGFSARLRQLLHIVLVVTIGVTPMAAQASEQGADEEAGPLFFAARLTQVPWSDLDTSQPGTETNSKETQLSAGFYRFDLGGATVDIGFDYQYTRYEYEIVMSRNRDLHRIQFPLSFSWQQSAWQIDGYLAPGVSTSSNVLRNPLDRLSSDDVIVTGRVQGRYPKNPKMFWLLGLAYDRSFGEPELYPTVGVEYSPGDKWRLRIAFPDPEVSFTPTDRQTLVARVYPAGNQWHVLSDNLTDEFDYRFEALRAELTWSYQFWKRFIVDVTLGYETGRHHSFFDDQGTLVDAAADDQVLFAVGLRTGYAPLLATHGGHL